MAIALNTPIKRIIAFLLCLALFAMVIIPPQPAEAVAGAAALIAGAAVSSEVIGSVIATIILAATGVCFDNGFFGDTDNLSTAAYEVGYELVQDMILTGGNVATWIDEAIQAYQLLGGFTAGDEIEVPAEVLEYSRNWVTENYSLSDGDFVISEDAILLENGQVIKLSDPYCYSYTSSILNSLTIGTQFVPNGRITNFNEQEMTATEAIFDSGVAPVFAYGNFALYMVYFNESDCINAYGIVDGQCVFMTGVTPSAYCLCYYNNTLYLNYCNYSNNQISSKYNWSVDPSIIISNTSTISGTDALNNPLTEDKTLYIPSTVDMGTIGDYTVPAIQTLTSDMVLDGTVTDTETDDPIGSDIDISVNDSFTVPDTWSGFDAWLKTQAQTVTDYTSIIANKVNGIATDVADFGISIKEWINEKWETFSDFVLTIPDIIALNLEGIMTDVGELFKKPFKFIEDKFADLFGQMHDFLGMGESFASIWHYVIAWVGSLGPWLSTMFIIWSGLPYAMVLPVYATAAIVVVIGIYRRFFM